VSAENIARATAYSTISIMLSHAEALHGEY